MTAGARLSVAACRLYPSSRWSGQGVALDAVFAPESPASLAGAVAAAVLGWLHARGARARTHAPRVARRWIGG